MKFQIALILVGCAVLAVECHRLANVKVTEGRDVVHSVPEPERPVFLAYSLGHGFMEQYRFEHPHEFPFPTLLRIPKSLEKKFQALEKPDNFASNLYEFVTTTYGLSSSDMFQLILRRKICFPHGSCVDLENIGEMCCPF